MGSKKELKKKKTSGELHEYGTENDNFYYRIKGLHDAFVDE